MSSITKKIRLINVIVIFFALNLILIKSCSIQKSLKSKRNHRNQLKIKIQNTVSGVHTWGACSYMPKGLKYLGFI